MLKFELSNAQKRTIITEINNPGNEAYIIAFQSKYPLEDIGYVKDSLKILIGGNLHLRITKDEEMNFQQYYADEEDGQYTEIDLSSDSDKKVANYINLFSKKPFKQIFDSALYEFQLLKTHNEVLVLGRTHHLIMDGTSVNIFAQNLETSIKALKKGEEYLPSQVSYKEYVQKEQEYLSSPAAEEDEDFWLTNLDGYSMDWYSSEDNDIKREFFYLKPELTKKLMELSLINGSRISPFVLALSAVSLYFNKSSGHDEMVWNSVYHGRDFGEQFHDMLGMFVNMMPLKLSYYKDYSFADTLLATKEVLKKGLTHGKLSFNIYGAKLQQKGIEPAMLSMYSMVSNSTESNIEYLINHNKSEFPFHIRVNPSLSDKDGLQLLLIEYNTACFTDEQIKDIIKGIQKLLEDVAFNPHKSCHKFIINPNSFFKAEQYFKELFKETDKPTIISSDIKHKKKGILKEQSKSFKTDAIKNFIELKQINPDSLFLSATILTLSKFVFSKEVLISLLSNNEYIGQELPYALNMDTNTTVEDFISLNYQFQQEVVGYDYYPYNKIRNEEFILPEFIFAYHNIPVKPDKDKFRGMALHICNDEEMGIIRGYYDSGVYSDELIETFLQSIIYVIKQFTAHPDRLLKDISLIPEDKNHDFHIEMVDKPLLNKLFESQVEENRDEIALIAADGEYSYDELNRKANRIAHALLKRGVMVEDRILFMLKRDSRLIATVLGIVKAGCAFIPVDPEYPEERINQVLEDSKAKYIITDKQMANALHVDDLLLETNEENPNPQLTPDSLCFIIYTSGSTGKPKGVMLTHGGITNYVSSNPQNLPIHALVNQAHKMISISTVSFIVFLREIFATMMNNMPVIFADEEQAMNPLELVKLFKKSGADAFGATPTRLLQYLELDEFQKILNQCKFIIVGGEIFPPQLYNLLSNYTDAEIYNSYGPTEITIASHGKLLTSDNISVGEPLLNVTDLVMDIDSNPLPPNVVGELYVAGAGVARGYWNNEELTQERFITYNGLRYYNTGDLAKRDNHGELYTLGRLDRQIKLRGLRIELGEIENALNDYPGIKSAYILVKNLQENEHLCAYYTGDAHIDLTDLRNYLSTKLPAYMVPTYFVKLESFPMTPNGKADLRNFPEPETDDYQLEDIIAPESVLEKDIFDICSEILDTKDFGVTTDLFHLGLTSLSVLNLVAQLSNKLGLKVMVTNIMRARNIREIAKEVSSSAILKEKHYQKQKFYPLTPNQLGVYFDCVKTPEKTTYNLPKCIRLGPGIDPQKLKNSILSVIENHPYLKTGFVMMAGEIQQERRDYLQVDIPINKGPVGEEVINNFIKPFNLYEDLLFRFEIFENNDETCVLADFHHIIIDGTSLNLLFHEVGVIYDGGTVEKEKYNGFDYSLEELDIKESSLYHEAEVYYDQVIPNFDSATIITPDLNGREESGNLGEIRVSLNKNKILNYCKEQAITPNNLFLSTTLLSLTKFVYNKDILISTISNGRGNPQFQKTIAMMVKTLPLTFNVNSDFNLSDYYEYVEGVWLEALKYECYPFTKISDKYDVYPEFLYAYHGKIIEEIQINNQKIQRESLEYEALKFKLSVNFVDTGEDFEIFAQFNDALYSQDLIHTFVKSLEVILEKFISNSELFIKDISIMGDQSEEKLLMKPVPSQLLNELFEKQVQLHTDDLAVIAEDGEYTYGDINKKANRIANALIKRGVEIEDRVMFMLKRDSNLIATIFGIVKAGCAFIPVDPGYPKDRIQYVLEDSQAKYIITKADIPGALDLDELLLEENENNSHPNLNPENLCYLIYTSGSTGNPKGVMLSHANITNYVSPDPQNCYAHAFTEKATRILSIATVSFDLFLHEAFIPLLNGLTLIFASDDQANNPLLLIDLFEKSQADSFSATPSRMLQYIEIEGIKDALANCTVITVAGEKYPVKLHKQLQNCTKGEIYNVYGPTECTISCNTTHVTTDRITVGKPLLNVFEKVVDLDGNPVPRGVVGELYVGGMGVTRGYWNRDELNREKFVTMDGIRYYKTGDFACLEKDGEYSILGRLDNQIKLRGLRIEIGEIENAIADYEGIKSVVVVVKNVNGNDHLCAYLTADDNVDVDDLKKQLHMTLTKYMVPSIFMQLEELPQTPNGKTDVKSLPEPSLVDRDYVIPEDDGEKFFAEAFEETLGIEKVGATDDFFDLGGTSLLVTKITMGAMKHGYEIKYGDVFANPTPRKLAQFIENVEEIVNEHEDYSYEKINDILSKNNISNFVHGELEDLGNVLLTGATGFLGIHVLHDFLENEKGSIYCLLRRGKRTGPEERLKTLLFYYFSKSYEELFGSRIHIIEGDITRSQDFEKAQPLPIDTVINCAANVKHFAAGTQIEDINIGGVKKGVEFCKKKGCRYIQVSTTSVAGESVDNFPPLSIEFDEQTLYVGQALDNKYLSSKFLAERIVLEAVSQGLDAKIMRAGNLMARHADSEFQINFETNSFIKRLKAYGAMGKIPYAVLGSEVELTPIDSTARAILLLARTPRECVLFHVYNNHNIYVADIIDIMNSVGFKIKGTEEDEFEHAFTSAMEDESQQESISGLVTAVGMGKGKGRSLVPVVNNYTIQILYRLAYKWPLISDEYLIMFIKYLKDMNFFD